MDQETVRKIVTGVAAVGAGVLARKLVAGGFSRAAGRPPPRNPADPEVPWKEALAFAAATGAVVGVARVVGRRGAEGAVHRVFG